MSTAHAPIIERTRVGTEGQPLVTVDGFAADADALRAAAEAATFVPAGEHYPGVRAALPDDYMARQIPVIAAAIGRVFGGVRRIHVIDASFSIVTTPPAALTAAQRRPHVDGYGAERVALVHYLSRTRRDGTAFFRHRATGFETIDEARAPTYRARLAEEGEAGAGYLAGDSPAYEVIARVDAAYNRAVLYRSRLLHSGAIDAAAPLPADPATGRLTVTAFLALE